MEKGGGGRYMAHRLSGLNGLAHTTLNVGMHPTPAGHTPCSDKRPPAQTAGLRSEESCTRSPGADTTGNRAVPDTSRPS